MKSLSSPGSAFCGIEPLEGRIAPAAIIKVGNPNSTQDIEYTDQPFRHLADGTDLISSSVRNGGTVADNAYALYLSAGDVLQLFNTSTGFDDFITVKSGHVVAFFIDSATVGVQGEVDAGELVSLSLGKNVNISVSAGLTGDVLTNLDEKGTSTTSDDSISMTGLVSGLQGIKSLNIGGGDVTGKVMSGGDISKISVNGKVGAILAGAAVNRLNPAGETFDLLPGVDGGGGTVSFTPAAGKAGGSISNVFVNAIGTDLVTGAEARIEAGSGGAGGKGGSLSNIRVVNDSDGFSLIAGAGGAGSVSGKVAGGAGGTINKIYISGVPDLTPNDLIHIETGAGGAAAAGSNGVGGKGGLLSNVYVGFQLTGGKPFQTLDPLNDTIEVIAGAGGVGKNGGAGGTIKTINVITTAPDGTGDEISIVAGAGGASTSTGSGKGGLGGSLSAITVRDLAIEGATPLETSVLLQAGSGGAGNATATGGSGGSISSTTVVGAEFSVLAGNGANGKVGGNGGNLSGITSPLAEGVVSHVAVLSAGFGGDGGAGNGGKGGSVKTVRNEFGDFTEYLVNPGNGGNGGNSAQAKGGVGGSLTALDLFDGATGAGVGGLFTVKAGNGGDGKKGAGAGGTLTKSQFIALDMNVDVRSGTGGDIVVGGAASGARGGLIEKVQIQAGISVDTPITASVVSGLGGNGAGTKGAGGVGGDIKSLNVRYSGTALIQAGDGGNGDGGKAGNGGSIILSGGFGTEDIAGDGSMLAGNAGANGSGPGTGGSISGVSSAKLTGLYANDNLTIKGGNGTHGGAGGSISFLGYGGTNPETLLPSPQGNIVIMGGAGSAEGKSAGAGGSLNYISGSVASGPTSVTTIQGGDGGGVPTASKSGAGGSVSNLTVFLGGGVGTELRIKAGDAGDASTSVAKGAKGGQVSNVTVSEIEAETLLRSIAAGDGGAAGQTGGQGGSIIDVQVDSHEIGVLIGEEYGYDTMGGVFAGAGGTGATPGKAGSVSGLTATAIAAIVAGREATPALVERVDNVYVGTPQVIGKPIANLLLVREGDVDPTDGGAVGDSDTYGAYVLDRYLTGNFVGAVVDPTRVDANQFRYTDTNGDGRFTVGDVPIDGLIATKVLDQKTINFAAEASLIGAVLNDWDNFVV